MAKKKNKSVELAACDRSITATATSCEFHPCNKDQIKFVLFATMKKAKKKPTNGWLNFFNGFNLKYESRFFN